MTHKIVFTVLFAIGALTDVWANSASFLSGTITEEHKAMLIEKMGKSLEKCVEETGVKLEDLGQLGTVGEEKLCFVKCLATQNGSLDADGNIQLDTLRENLRGFGYAEEKLDQILECASKLDKIEACSDIYKFDACDMP